MTVMPFRVRQKSENQLVDSKIAGRPSAERSARLGQATVGSQPFGDNPGILSFAFLGAVSSKQDISPSPQTIREADTTVLAVAYFLLAIGRNTSLEVGHSGLPLFPRAETFRAFLGFGPLC